MITSMTAFARIETYAEWGTLVWEIRSLNHRYLEIQFRLPETFQKLETMLREQVKNKLYRGKIEISLKYVPSTSSANQITINEALVIEIVRAHESIVRFTKNSAPLNITSILQWPGVIQTTQPNLSNQEDVVVTSFSSALDELLSARNREGLALQETIQQRLLSMQNYVKQIQNLYPGQINSQREKLQQRFKDAKLAIDPSRLEQEILIFIQKIDIAEELDRLNTHIKETEKTLQSNNAANGRRLDFLMQELNREANTLAAKSISTEITLAAVELKVLIDQLREQIQNVE